MDQNLKETLSALKDVASRSSTSRRAPIGARASAPSRGRPSHRCAGVDRGRRSVGERSKARRHLASVSQDFSRYSDRVIREAYEAAERLQVELSVARERENALRKKHDELERSLLNIKRMVEKAENMVSRCERGQLEYLPEVSSASPTTGKGSRPATRSASA